MESKSYSLGASILFKRIIPIDYQTTENPKDIAYLSDEKCAVSYQKFVLIVDLNKKRKDKVQVISVSKGWSLNPVANGFSLDVSYGRHASAYQFYDIHGKKTTIAKAGGTFSSNNFITFYYSRRSFSKMTAWTSAWVCEISSQQNKFNINQSYANKVVNKANDTQSIYVDYGKNQRTVLNLVTQKTSKIALPKSQKFLFSWSSELYLIDQYSGLFAIPKKQEEGGGVVLGIVTFGSQGKWEYFSEFPGYQTVRFTIMNSQLSLLVLHLAQYGNTKLQKKQNITVVYNYKLKQIVFSLSSQQVNINGWSPDFTHLIQSFGRNQKNDTIVDYQPISTKKLIMHLVKKSNLHALYGNDLIQKIFKVII